MPRLPEGLVENTLAVNAAAGARVMEALLAPWRRLLRRASGGEERHQRAPALHPCVNAPCR